MFLEFALKEVIEVIFEHAGAGDDGEVGGELFLGPVF
jgi:hypothetical protein